MAGVAYPRGNGRIRGVLCSRMARTRSGLGGSEGRVDICKIWLYICHVIRKPQLGRKAVRIVVCSMKKGDLISAPSS
jgi:hypothetical protein